MEFEVKGQSQCKYTDTNQDKYTKNALAVNPPWELIEK
jgi:hypothetical protein